MDSSVTRQHCFAHLKIGLSLIYINFIELFLLRIYLFLIFIVTLEEFSMEIHLKFKKNKTCAQDLYSIFQEEIQIGFLGSYLQTTVLLCAHFSSLSFIFRFCIHNSVVIARHDPGVVEYRLICEHLLFFFVLSLPLPFIPYSWRAIPQQTRLLS